MYAKELIKLLKQSGCCKISQNGSHLKMRTRNNAIIIPIHNKKLPIGTTNTILKQVGLK